MFSRYRISFNRWKGGIVIGKWFAVWALLIIVAVMSPCCLGSRTPPVSRTPAPAVLADYYRTGGIAGLQDRLVIFDNGVTILSSRTGNHEIELNRTEIERITYTFDQAQFSMLEANYSGRHGGADLIRYTISYRGKTVTAEDTAIPPSLQAVIDELNRVITMSEASDTPPQSPKNILE